jgi:hypothetical protein
MKAIKKNRKNITRKSYMNTPYLAVDAPQQLGLSSALSKAILTGKIPHNRVSKANLLGLKEVLLPRRGGSVSPGSLSRRSRYPFL